MKNPDGRLLNLNPLGHLLERNKAYESFSGA
jgi:hypothetical protein